MEIRQLRYLVGIIDAGSISRAALALHVAQPALSLQMNQLEARLGVKLLNRSVRGVTATEAGAAVYRHAKQLLRQLEATQAIAAQADLGPAGPVTLGLPWTVSSVIGLPLLRAVLEALPAVKLQVTEGPSALLAALVAQGRVDLAIVFGNTPDQALSLQPVIEEPLWLVSARGTGPRSDVCSVAESARYPLVLMSPPNGIREQLDRLWLEAGVKPRIVADINSPGLLMAAVEQNIGSSILPSASVAGPSTPERLDRVLLNEGSVVRTAYLGIARQYAASRALECVAQLLIGCVAQAVEQGKWQGRLLAGTAQTG